jgi:hypothetical protein
MADEIENVVSRDAAPQNAAENVEHVETREESQAEPAAPKVRGIDDTRARLYEAAKARRAQDDDFKPYASDEEERKAFGKHVETSFDRDQARNPEPEPEAPAPTRRKLRVQGREIEVSEDEVTALAQQAAAAGDILGKAKAIRANFQSKLEALNAQQAATMARGQQTSQQQAPSPEDTKPGDDELDAIIDSIQVGDKAEAAQALEKYGHRLEARILQRFGDLDTRIADTTRTLAENERRQNESNAVLQEFSRENPEFDKNPSLAYALYAETLSTMRNLMAEMGVDNQTFENLKRQHGLNDESVIGYSYRHLQSQGYQLPNHGDLLRQSAQRLRQAFGLTQQQSAPDLSQRVARKEAMAPQPRRANVAPGAANAEANINDTRREAVRQIKMARRGRA